MLEQNFSYFFAKHLLAFNVFLFSRDFCTCVQKSKDYINTWIISCITRKGQWPTKLKYKEGDMSAFWFALFLVHWRVLSFHPFNLVLSDSKRGCSPLPFDQQTVKQWVALLFLFNTTPTYIVWSKMNSFNLDEFGMKWNPLLEIEKVEFPD